VEPKLAHKIALAALSIAVIIFLVGFIYVDYSDQNPSTLSNNKTKPSVYKPIAPPPPTSPDNTEGVALEAMSSPVIAGNTASLSVLTDNTSTCTLTIANPLAPKLKPVITNPYGVASWTWLVPKNTPAGNWSITIDCFFHHKEGVLIETMPITTT